MSDEIPVTVQGVVETLAVQAAEEVVDDAVKAGIARGVAKAAELLQSDAEMRAWQTQTTEMSNAILGVVGRVESTLLDISARMEAVLALAVQTPAPTVVVTPPGPAAAPMITEILPPEAELPAATIPAAATPDLSVGAGGPRNRQGRAWL